MKKLNAMQVRRLVEVTWPATLKRVVKESPMHMQDDDMAAGGWQIERTHFGRAYVKHGSGGEVYAIRQHPRDRDPYNAQPPAGPDEAVVLDVWSAGFDSRKHEPNVSVTYDYIDDALDDPRID